MLSRIQKETPAALICYHNDNIKGYYETIDEEIIIEMINALKEVEVILKASEFSIDNRDI